MIRLFDGKRCKGENCCMSATNRWHRYAAYGVIIFLISHLSFLISSCARMGSPDGGWYDETPPRVVSCSPEDKGVNVRAKKISINFDEYIKIEDAQNKVIVSPPQLEQADIRAAGKKIIVELHDTLKENTTYTVDFSDAISDNNEGNPMGHYTYSFSTGDHIDTLEVAGYCLNAENLEPMKGVLVGLYPHDVADSVFHKEPMIRVSRSNSAGQFTIKGVAPGKYRAFALQDADGDYVFGQKSEAVAFSPRIIEPTSKPDTRQDTIWRDTLHIDNILRVGYTHFLPDDVTMLCFQEPQTNRSLLKTERSEPHKLGIYFTYGNDTLPKLKGLNFEGVEKFFVETTEKNDTLTYWIADSTLINQDTLNIELTYLMTDSLDQLVEQTDTIEFIPKVGYEKRMKEQQKVLEDWQKAQEKKKKKGESYDSIMPVKPLEFKMTVNGSMDPDQRFFIEVPEPLAKCDTSAIHLYQKIDSTWFNCPHSIKQISVRRYELVADWKPEMELSLEMDSDAFHSIYGLSSDAKKTGIKVKSEKDFSTLMVEMTNTNDPDTGGKASDIIVVLVNTSDAIVKTTRARADGTAFFKYVKPGKYYLRAFFDLNHNGVWDTGCYDEGLQAEPVYYFNEEVECKQKWDVTRKWNLTAQPRFKQKPSAIIKQKPEAAKKQKSQNLDRAKRLGKEYMKDKGVRL